MNEYQEVENNNSFAVISSLDRAIGRTEIDIVQPIFSEEKESFNFYTIHKALQCP